MSSANRQWDDLMPRIISALVMVAVGVWAIFSGGFAFDGLLLLIAAVGFFELLRMQMPRLGKPVDLAIFLAYGGAIIVACLAFSKARSGADGLWAVGYFVAIVVISDIAGYFAGRLIGGPKFWPRFSPKKTWSGTVAGWIGAALVGVVFAQYSGPSGIFNGINVGLIASISAILAFAAQLGDIGESAIKRRSGVKDSSNLIPGHGGVLDRFDGMIGLGVVVAVFLPLLAG